jgi:hypothetical protein
MVHRIKDFRFSYDLELGDLEPVSSNYYPINSGDQGSIFAEKTGVVFKNNCFVQIIEKMQ